MDRVMAALFGAVLYRCLTSWRWLFAMFLLACFVLAATGCDEVQSDYERRQRGYFGDIDKPAQPDKKRFDPLGLKDGRDE